MQNLVADTGVASEPTVVPVELQNRMSFNVMPGRPVTETLHIREYRVGEDYIEARFDRTYESEMRNSPSHLIFLSALAHLQKMIYVYGCHRLGLGYDPHGPEVLKIWPTVVRVEMSKMIRDETDLVHRAEFDAFDRVGANRYHLHVRSNVNDILQIGGETPLYVI